MLDILIICGTRPEIIKLAPVYHALRNCGWARPVWLHTGQHGDMARQMLACFDIEPDIELSRAGDSLAQFSRSWEANGLVYEGIKALFGDGDAGCAHVREEAERDRAVGGDRNT